MTNDEITAAIKKMTIEERKDLASRMWNPVKICRRMSAKDHNNIIREANPRWSEEALRPYLCDEEPIITPRNEIKIRDNW